MPIKERKARMQVLKDFLENMLLLLPGEILDGASPVTSLKAVASYYILL